MQFFALATVFVFAATASAQGPPVRGTNGNCGFPNGPTCIATGNKTPEGSRIFTDPANSPGEGCCLFPLRCGNGDGDGGVPPCAFVANAPVAKKGSAKKNSVRSVSRRRTDAGKA